MIAAYNVVKDQLTDECDRPITVNDLLDYNRMILTGTIWRLSGRADVVGRSPTRWWGLKLRGLDPARRTTTA